MDPEIRGLEILTEGDAPMLHLAYEGRTVPAGLAGDGVESLVRLALELSMRDRGTVLIEEPEAHQHSRAIAQSAKVLVAAARTGCQVILTTHSMELLDDLLAELTDDEHSWLAVYRTRLDQGQLRVMRVKGEDVSAVRAGIGDDLR
jgi:predicted ATPase